MLELLIIIGLIIYFTNRNPKNKTKKESKRQEPVWDAARESEWRWDEEKQLWIHPKSIDAKTENQNPEEKDGIDYRNAYQARYLLTKNEWQQYKKLKEIADVKGYVICPKVRLLDIIEPKRGEQKYKTLFYKIQAKHIDFLICDKDLHIKAIIELDDNSHNQQSRKERDEFVDMILRSVGYKVIHTRYITPDILDTV